MPSAHASLRTGTPTVEARAVNNDMISLAERCEAAAGKDRDLDWLLHRERHAKLIDDTTYCYFGPEKDGRWLTYRMPHRWPWSRALAPRYTKSIDAAMTLATDPCLRKFGGPSGMLREAMDRLGSRFALHMRRWPNGENYGEWLARFICAASLRARALSTVSRGESDG